MNILLTFMPMNILKINDLLTSAKEHTELSRKTQQKKQKLNFTEHINDFNYNFVNLLVKEFKNEMDKAFKIDNKV